MSFIENTKKPLGLGGELMVSMMNIGHRALSEWGLGFVKIPTDADVLDCGCGGGANLKRLAADCPRGTVTGIDVSEVSVRRSSAKNRAALRRGQCRVLRADVSELPFASGSYDLVTAFETVYFWRDREKCFGEVFRVLRDGGTFLICNECGGDDPRDEKWTKMIDGMTIYNDGELKTALESAGFRCVRAHKNKKGWLCVTAVKHVNEGTAHYENKK